MVYSSNMKQTDILMEKLKQLSAQDRILIGLYFYENLSVGEIAEILEWQVNTVEQNLNRLLPYLSAGIHSHSEQPALHL